MILQTVTSDRNVRGPLPVDPAGIPAELKQLPRWVAWVSKPRANGKAAKLPLNPRTGRAADITDPRHFVGFDDAFQFHLDRGTAGVGFGLFAADPFTAVDLDGCRDPDTGDLDPLTRDALARLDTYAEVSPSGAGVRAFGLGKIDPAGPKRRGNVELYSDARFVTVTGVHVPDTPCVVEKRDDALRWLQATLAPPAPPRVRTLGVGGFSGDDRALLDRAFRAKNGDRVRALFDGRHDKSSYSEALLGLARLLAFWVGDDAPRLERLLTGSALWAAAEAERRKWSAPRRGGSWGMVYVARRAIDSCPVFFTGTVSRPAGASPSGSPPHCVSKDSLQLAPLRTTPKRTPRNPVSVALGRADAGHVPPGLDAITSRRSERQAGLRRLAAVVWHLAGRRAGGRCRVSITAAGTAFGVSPATVSRRLNELRRRGVIRRVRWGNSFAGVATEWEWRGPGTPRQDRDPAAPSAARAHHPHPRATR